MCGNGEKVLTFTVNVPGVSLGPGELLIKDWSENEGALDFLLENDLVESTNRAVLTGYAMAPVVRMTDQLIHILGVHCVKRVVGAKRGFAIVAEPFAYGPQEVDTSRRE